MYYTLWPWEDDSKWASKYHQLTSSKTDIKWTWPQEAKVWTDSYSRGCSTSLLYGLSPQPFLASLHCSRSLTPTSCPLPGLSLSVIDLTPPLKSPHHLLPSPSHEDIPSNQVCLFVCFGLLINCGFYHLGTFLRPVIYLSEHSVKTLSALSSILSLKPCPKGSLKAEWEPSTLCRPPWVICHYYFLSLA